MELGYGQTAPYGELQYKGYDYPTETSYFDIAVSNMIEQYRKNYINTGNSTTVIVPNPVVIPAGYPDRAVNLVIAQYREDYVNG